MDLSVSVPHPHATLLLSPSASMPTTLTVVDVATVEEVNVLFVTVPYEENHRSRTE